MPAAGADDDIRISHAGGPHMLRERFFSYLCATCGVRGSYDLRSSTVRKADPQREPFVLRAVGLDLIAGSLQILRQALTLSHDSQAHAFCYQLLRIFFDDFAHQVHQVTDFFFSALPVLGGECEYREVRDTARFAPACAFFQTYRSFAMPHEGREPP